MAGKQKILIIVGPTASGKSALAVALAKKFNGEVISADSRQVYRGLDIGTGKITKREMKGVPHHLLDEASPHRTFTAHDFVVRARQAIEKISSRGKLPIVVGGTGLYIDALTGRITLPNVSANLALRARLKKKSAVQLFAMLKKRDRRRAKTIEPQNKRRLIRALEIVATLGHVPHNDNYNDFVNRYDTLWIGIAPPMKELQRKMAIRLFARIRRGMITEAKRLHARGLSYKRMKALGLEYRSLARLLQGEISRAELEAELTYAIRRYAKRQLTYWKRNKDILWFKNPRTLDISKTIRDWLRRLGGPTRNRT